MTIRPGFAASLLLALLAGAGTVFSFAPFGWWPLQILLLATAFVLALRQPTRRRTFLLGWAFGLAWNVAGMHWLFISMHRYGGMPAWMAALAVVLLGLYMGLFAACAFGGAAWLRRRWSVGPAAMLLLLLPSLWALSEWARGWVLTGFPWVASGYAHSASPLAGFAPVVGVYGIGSIVALLAGCLASALIYLRDRKMPRAALTAALAVVLCGSGLVLRTIHWTGPSGQPISVRLLQGNVGQEMKFQPDQIMDSLLLYQNLIQAAPADLIATPETALPVLAQQLPAEYLTELASFARRSGSFITLGIVVSDSTQHYANSALGISPTVAGDGKLAAFRYDKHHLVPFGEFIPTGFRWFVNMMHIPLGDMDGGARLQAPFPVKDQEVLPNICYEDLFGAEIADQIAARHFSGARPVTVLLNMSNIAWFGDSIALPHHLQISQLRALETGRPMLRATNTGMTAVIGPDGQVQSQLHPYTRDTLAASVQGMSGNTPYILYGNNIMLGISLLMLLTARFLARRNNMTPTKPHN